MCTDLHQEYEDCTHTKFVGVQRCNKPVGVLHGCFGPSGRMIDPTLSKIKGKCYDCEIRAKDPNPAGRDEERKQREDEQKKKQGR
ncbi:hypothetical protein NKR19_g4047 [Coniochaeta hoffmannii]|uniref:Uncharacterized protein n=1 Tax=Coniochaeta hoffmannii TaxID=91930 RepID=A0AA38S639_9PEZI|nr:hypothetical protein NKR19_g4047 [Coniochaeta hoffmannii]